jgi:hypothetical protein
MLIGRTRENEMRTHGLFALTLLALIVSCGASQAQVTVIQNFAGLNTFDDAALNRGGFFIPPDEGSAVGPNHYMQALNLVTAVYNKDGTIASPRQTLGNFFASAGVAGLGNGLSDPRVEYDPSSGRWFVAAITTSSNSNNFVLAVSQTSDPTGAWKATSWKANNLANNFADYPTIGLDKNGFYIASNNFLNGSSFDGVSLTSIPKADLLLGGGPSVANRTLTENIVGGGTAGTTPFTLAPVTTFDTRQNAGTNYGVVIATDGFNAATVLHRYNVSNPQTNSPTLSGDSPISVPSYWTNQLAHQPNGTRTLDGGDFRIGSDNVFEVGGKIWAAQSILTSAATGNGVYNAIRWYEIDEATNTLLQSGTISDPHHDYIYPSIAANNAGNVVIGFTGTGDNTTTDFPGSWYTAGTTSGGVTTFGTPQLLKQGSGNYSISDGTRNRWGDFSAISVDPTNANDFWIAEEVAIPGVQSLPVLWGTQISEIQFTPEPGTLTLFIGMGVLGLAAHGWRRYRQARSEAAAA